MTFWDHIYSIFIATPTGLILSIVTLVVGFIALWIYWRQHKDDRQLAAQAIYSEVNTAENRLKGIRTRFFEIDQPNLEWVVLMRYESWSRYKSRFLNILTPEEWNSIDQFYNNCLAYDDAVSIDKHNLKHIVTENYRHLYAHYQHVVETYHNSHPNKIELPETTIKQLLNYEALYLSNKAKGRYDYTPRQAIAAARSALVALDTSITTSTAGAKLKKLAKV